MMQLRLLLLILFIPDILLSQKVQTETLSWPRTPIGGGFFKACKNGKCKVLDRSGKVITKEDYDNIGVFVNGQACVFKGKQMGYIDTLGVARNFTVSDATGYSDLNKLIHDFAKAMNSKNDSLLLAFCRNIAPDKHTISFIKRNRIDKYSELSYDIDRKQYKPEDMPKKFFDNLKRISAYLDQEVPSWKLKYIPGADNPHFFPENETFCIESIGQVSYSTGKKVAKFEFGGLARFDGIWKSIATPSMIERPK